MRVGIDGSHWQNRRGFGRFTRNIVRSLVEQQDAQYVVFLDQRTAVNADLPAGLERAIVRTAGASLDESGEDARRTATDVLRFTRAARAAKLDALLFPSPYTWFPAPGTPTVVGIHDTIGIDFPDLALPSARSRFLWHAKERLAMRSAKRIFTVSEGSRAALSERFHIDPRTLPIVSEAPDPIFRPVPVADARQLVAPYGVSPETGFILYVGGISPHKNVEGLVDAYASVLAARPGAPPLVLVGDLEGEAYASSAASVRARLGATGVEASVRLVGFVPDRVLAALYSTATVVALPSLAEGFGLPAVEAAACGAPVVLSDLPSHRESLDTAGCFVPPGDTDGLGNALIRLLDDEALRSDVGERCAAAVAHRTWDAAARTVHDLLLEVAR